MPDFENPKTPEEIRKINKERDREEIDLSLEGAKVDENERLIVTNRQFRQAEREMEDDLLEREQEKQKIDTKISRIEKTLGQSISEESKELILQNVIQKSDTANKQENPGKKDESAAERKPEKSGENIDKKTLESAIIEKLKSVDPGQDIRKIMLTLRDREEKRFNRVIDPDAIRQFAFSANELESAKTMEDITNAFSKLIKIIRLFGEVPRATGARDDVDSLKRVSWSLRNLNDKSIDLRGKLSGFEDKNVKDIIAQLHSLQGALGEKWAYIIKKANALESFRGR